MKRRRKVIAIVLFATTVVCAGSRRAMAQDAPPDLRMLMNLDLFESHPGDVKGDQAAADGNDDSMLDQIRALNAMGYLGHRPGVGGNGAPEAASSTAALPSEANAPSSSPDYGVEGPQP
jgi:hypothetical protein